MSGISEILDKMKIIVNGFSFASGRQRPDISEISGVLYGMKITANGFCFASRRHSPDLPVEEMF